MTNNPLLQNERELAQKIRNLNNSTEKLKLKVVSTRGEPVAECAVRGSGPTWRRIARTPVLTTVDFQPAWLRRLLRSIGARLIGRLVQVLDNIEITVNNIHIRFEGDQPLVAAAITSRCADDTLLSVDGAPPAPFNLGVHVKKIVGFTCDEHGTKVFDSNPSKVVKKLTLEGLGVYCNAQ